jgi:hypothetical protein
VNPMLESQAEKPRATRIRGFKSRSSALTFWTNLGLGNAVLIGVLVVWVHGGRETTGIAWAGASLALGGLLGFLFGIPGRQQGTVQINQPGVAAIDTEINKATGTGGGPVMAAEGDISSSVPSSAQDSHSDPSNLEQVSDWVTKLLLGGGLTQLQQIPRMIWELSYSVAVGIDPNASGQNLWSEQAFASGVLIYFFVTGFFGGYLITKLQLGRRLRS